MEERCPPHGCWGRKEYVGKEEGRRDKGRETKMETEKHQNILGPDSSSDVPFQ